MVQTWDVRERPILEAILAAEEAGQDIDSPELITQLNLGRGVAQAGIRALYEADFITGIDASAGGETGFALLEIRLLEKGRRHVGQWPSENPFDGLVALLESRIEQEQDSETKSRLAKLREALGDVGKTVGTALLVAWAKQQTGL